MQSVQGCAWIDLRFSLTENGEHAIDQFGMTSSSLKHFAKSCSLTSYSLI